MPESLFERDGEAFVPTELTRGGWNDVGQHGGPPCGLLAHAVEQVETPSPMQVVRLTFDLFREVPCNRPLRLETEVVRAGLRIQMVEARMYTGDVEVARATGLKIRTREVDVGTPPMPEWQPMAPPGEYPPSRWDDFSKSEDSLIRFHRDAVEIRSHDETFFRAGRGLTWFRLAYPLIAGERTSPLETMATLADLANGNSRILDPHEWLFTNPDLSVALLRVPRGEWIGMDSVSWVGDHGIGFADTRVFDLGGPCGRITQSQLIDHRG